MEMPTLEAIKRLVEQEMGVALVPRLTAQIEIERKQIAALAVKEMRFERRLQLILSQGCFFITCSESVFASSERNEVSLE